MERKNVNQLIILLEIAMVAVMAFLVIQISHYQDIYHQTEDDSKKMLILADELRQSSDDLTSAARAYVITKDEKFKTVYFNILDIRNGKAPMPENYAYVYWDLKQEIRDKKHPLGESKSFDTIIDELPFSQEERDKLLEAEKESNTLAQLEIEAFNALNGLFKDASGSYTIKDTPNSQYAINLIYSQPYYDAKHRIMEPIDDFMRMLNERLENTYNSLKDDIAFYETFLVWWIGGFIFVNMMIYRYLSRLSVIDKNNLTRRIEERTAELVASQMANVHIKERLELALNATNDGLWDWNMETNEVYFSSRWKEMLGYEEDEISGSLEEWKKRVHPDDLEQVYKDMQGHLNGNVERYSNEHRVLCKDGTYKWILDRGRVSEYSPAGKPLRMIGTYTDVSEKKRLREQVDAEHLKYQNMLRLATDGVYIMKSDGSLMECSKHAADMLGYTLDELLALKVFDWDHDITAEEYNVLMDRLTDDPVTIERIHYRKDGSTYDAEITASKIMINDEVYVYASVRDVSERNKTHYQMEVQKREQEILLSLFDKGDSVLFKWNNDAHWSIAYASDNVDRLLGYTKEAFIQGDVVYAACIFEEDLPHVIEEVQNAVKINSDYFVHDPYRIRTQDGEIKWVLDYTVTQKDEKGNITHFIGYLNDITKQKHIEKELVTAICSAEKANESKSAFLANMSHEIRTPMNAILGFVEQLAKDEKDPDRLKQFQIIKNSGKTLLNIINDILDLSKIESGKMDIEAHPYNLQEFFEESGTLFDGMMHQKQISYHASMSESVPLCILTDQVRLKQVVFNLISNAIKFTPEHGTISFDIGYDTGNLHVSVTDTGIGIAPENIEKIFNAFDQEDNTTTRRFGGTGLGLSISSKLIEMMGGKLKVESTLGKGSRFFFDIPATVCEPKVSTDSTQADQNSDNAAESASFSGHVLIVEDNLTNQMLLGFILDDVGLTYDIANNGVEAISMFKHNTYDIIMMDENMPEMNGIEATKHIRMLEKESGGHIPVVAVTANALEGDRQRFNEAGADEYVSKPYSVKDITTVLQKFCTSRKNDHA